MATKRITLGELENGMLIWNQGHLFTARNVQKTPTTRSGLPTATDTIAARPENHTTVRYEGVCASSNDDIKGTVYDGGVYGGFSWVPATIEECV